MTAHGLENAPVTRVLMILTAALTASIGSTNEVNLDLAEIMRGQAWRLFTSHFAFSNMAQALVGLITLYSSRHFERQLGVKKYAVFVVLAYVLSLLIQILVVSIIHISGLENFTPAQGPYFIIFALIAFYHAHIPKQSSRRIGFGLDFSEKTWAYILACQLLFSNGISSIGSGSIGIIIGLIYDHNLCGIQRVRLPRIVENSVAFTTSFLSSLFPLSTNQGAYRNVRQPTARPLADPRAFGHDQIYGWDEMDGELLRYGGLAPRRPVFGPPPEEAVQSIISLGFDRGTALAALEATGNNVEAAANRLLR